METALPPMYIAACGACEAGRQTHRHFDPVAFFQGHTARQTAHGGKMFARMFGLKSISPRELLPLIQEMKVVTFDVNSPQSWNKAHVPGARNVDPSSYNANDLPSDKTSSLVFYCSNFLCRKAPNAALRAKRMGYENVSVMSAGISGWLSAGLPTEAGK